MKMNQFVTYCAILAVSALFATNTWSQHGAAPPPDDGTGNIIAQHGAAPPPDDGTGNIIAQHGAAPPPDDGTGNVIARA